MNIIKFIDSRNGYRLRFIDDNAFVKVDSCPIPKSNYLPYPFEGEPVCQIAVSKDGRTLYIISKDNGIWKYGGVSINEKGGSKQNRLKYSTSIPKYVTGHPSIRFNNLAYTLIGFSYGGSKNPNTYIKYRFDADKNAVRDPKGDIKARVLNKGINSDLLGNKSKDTINHKDNNSANNSIDNLEVVSRTDNTILDNAIVKKVYKTKEDLLKDYPEFGRNYYFVVK